MAKGMVFSMLLFTILSVPSGWDQLWLLSYQYNLIIKGHVPSHSIIIGMDKRHGRRASSYSYANHIWSNHHMDIPMGITNNVLLMSIQKFMGCYGFAK